MTFFRYGCVLLILGLFAGCGAQKRTVMLPPQAAVSRDISQHLATGAPVDASLVAQFGARLNMAGQSAPVQGEVQINASGGSLALILPHGRTLGVCTYRPYNNVGGGAASGAGRQPVKMECTPAEGMGREAASLLVHAGVAVYRILPAFSQNATLPDIDGKGWSVRFSHTKDGVNGVYREQGGMTMDLYFVEISHL